MGNQVKTLRQKEVEKLQIEYRHLRALSSRPYGEAGAGNGADNDDDDDGGEAARAQAQAEAEQQRRAAAERERAAVAIQRTARGFLARRDYRLLRKRKRVVEELVATEETYVEALAILIDGYMKPLAALYDGKSGGRKERAEIRSVFGAVEVLLNINQELLARLHAMAGHLHCDTCVGDIFVSSVDYLRSYVQFVNNYNDALDVLARWREDEPGLGRQLAQLDTRQKGNLEMYLITPIQRIPRYVLLLNDLLRNTPKTHLDYVDLAVAVQKMEELAVLVNRRKMESDRNRDCMRIYTAIQPPLRGISLIAAHRQLLMDVDCYVYRPRSPWDSFLPESASDKLEALANRFGSMGRSAAAGQLDDDADSDGDSDSDSDSDDNPDRKPAPKKTRKSSMLIMKKKKPPSKKKKKKKKATPRADVKPSRVSKVRRLFLFNDLLIFCSPKDADVCKPKLLVPVQECLAVAIDPPASQHDSRNLVRLLTRPAPEYLDTVVDLVLLFESRALLSDFVRHVNSVCAAAPAPSPLPLVAPSSSSSSRARDRPVSSMAAISSFSPPTRPPPQPPTSRSLTSPSITPPSLDTSQSSDSSPTLSTSTTLSTLATSSNPIVLSTSSSSSHVPSSPVSTSNLLSADSPSVGSFAASPSVGSFAASPSVGSFAASPPRITVTSDDEPSTSKRGRIVDPFEPRPLPDGVLYEGYLQKKGHVRHNWKIRWFRVVEGGSTIFVNYFVDDAAPKPKGRVALSPAMAVQPTVHETRRNCFAIFPDAVSNFPLLTMSATCEHERYQWISLLESAIAKLAKRPPPTVV